LQISNRNTDSWSAWTKTCTYDQHMHKNPPKNIVWNASPPSPNRFSLSPPTSQQIFLKSQRSPNRCSLSPPKSQQIFLMSLQVPTDFPSVSTKSEHIFLKPPPQSQ
jgi:hypothetical protein